MKAIACGAPQLHIISMLKEVASTCHRLDNINPTLIPPLVMRIGSYEIAR